MKSVHAADEGAGGRQSTLERAERVGVSLDLPILRAGQARLERVQIGGRLVEDALLALGHQRRSRRCVDMHARLPEKAREGGERVVLRVDLLLQARRA